MDEGPLASHAVLVDGYRHRTGEHCASTALRNLLEFHGLSLSESMVFGLASGLGFYSIRSDALSPTRMFHGRTASLEVDFCDNTGIPVAGGEVEADDEAERILLAQLRGGTPVMLSTDTFYLDYQNTTSHFPKHRAVVVGFDADAGKFWIADRKLSEYQSATFEELRRARNAPDYPLSCANEYNHFRGRVELGSSLAQAIRRALDRNARWMLEDHAAQLPGGRAGVAGMRSLAEELPDWASAADWSWAARFGYQVIIKRGAGGHFFRSLYAGFLEESAAEAPVLGEAGLPERMTGIALRWTELAALLKEQSERETCKRQLFVEAAAVVRDLADREEALFRQLAALTADDALWGSTAESAHR